MRHYLRNLISLYFRIVCLWTRVRVNIYKPKQNSASNSQWKSQYQIYWKSFKQCEKWSIRLALPPPPHRIICSFHAIGQLTNETVWKSRSDTSYCRRSVTQWHGNKQETSVWVILVEWHYISIHSHGKLTENIMYTTSPQQTTYIWLKCQVHYQLAGNTVSLPC
jgi:hypothetical protein